jgi:hypothetical protein
MIYRIQHIKDVIGNNYLGIKFSNDQIDPYLTKLKEFLPSSEYEVYTSAQKLRDKDGYHLTVINVAEYNQLSKELGIDKFVSSLSGLFDLEIDDLKMLGIGTAKKNENQSYFIVCQSDLLQSIRGDYGLKEFDFHITLGFKYKDVFAVRKNEVIEPKSKFLDVVRSEFIKRPNFNFVKKIQNFDENEELEIIPISLNDKYLKVACGDFIMDIGLLEVENKLFIFTKYKKSQEVTRLPITEIINILKN